MVLRFTLFLLLLSPAALSAQNLWQLLFARTFHENYTQEEKIQQIQEMEYSGWVMRDTFFDLEKRLQIKAVDVSPFVNDEGASVFYVTEISPSFPGGVAVRSDYFENILGDLLTRPDEETHLTAFIQFLIREDGRIDAVKAANYPYIDETDARMIRCLEAVRAMPDWSPGQYKGRPVLVQYIVAFSLKI